VTSNVADVAPPATTIGLVTFAAALFEATDTLRPPAGAGLVSVTVPVEPTPPTTDLGESASALTVGAVTFSVAVFLELPLLADTVAVRFVATGTVATVNVAPVALAGTLTVAGTDTAALELPSDKVTPPDGAADVSVTVPFALVPPTTLEGVTVNAEIDCPDALTATDVKANKKNARTRRPANSKHDIYQAPIAQ
jgi:hypothetical protein